MDKSVDFKAVIVVLVVAVVTAFGLFYIINSDDTEDVTANDAVDHSPFELELDTSNLPSGTVTI